MPSANGNAQILFVEILANMQNTATEVSSSQFERQQRCVDRISPKMPQVEIWYSR